MGKLTMNLPNRPKGDAIEVPGLGLFFNGDVYEIDGPDIVFGEPLAPVKKVSPGRDAVDKTEEVED